MYKTLVSLILDLWKVTSTTLKLHLILLLRIFFSFANNLNWEEFSLSYRQLLSLLNLLFSSFRNFKIRFTDFRNFLPFGICFANRQRQNSKMFVVFKSQLVDIQSSAADFAALPSFLDSCWAGAAQFEKAPRKSQTSRDWMSQFWKVNKILGILWILSFSDGLNFDPEDNLCLTTFTLRLNWHS